MATERLTPIQSSISTDLERELREIQTSSYTGPPGDLDDKKKRWLVVGICLHSILSPSLRKYVDPIVTNMYRALKLSDQIDVQTHTKHLRRYGAAKIYLNYEAINNNKTTHGNRTVLWDYKVHNAVDLSKLFLQTHMAKYSAFDGSCDSSALLGMIEKIDMFPVNVKAAAKDARSSIRNPWAHCNFTEWDTVKLNLSLQKIEDFVYLLKINGPEESQIIGELNKWRTNGTSFFQGTTIGLELVDNIRQEIQVLVAYADVICKSGDTEFSRVHTELTEMGTKLSQNDHRISTLENSVVSQGKTLLEYESLYDADVPEIERWEQNNKDFIKTEIVTDILKILENHHSLLLIGVSGMGKTLAAQNIALHLYHEQGYRIVPCSNVKDIKKRYRNNVRQVFFIDDIFGKYTANISYIENWKRIVEFVKYFLDKGKTKILATCRTEIFKEENVKTEFKLFHEPFDLTVNYSPEDKMKIARKYLKENDKILTDIVIKDEFTPLMCFLYSQHDVFDVNEFLNSPYKTFSDEWDTLKTFDREKFCVLFLCVIYNGKINETIFDVLNDFDKEEKRKLKVIFECCKLGRDTSRPAIKDKLESCVDTYFIKVDTDYKVIHDKMFDFLCYYFGKALIAPILKFGDDKFLSERLQLESIQKPHGDFTILISSTEEHKYNDRLRTDVKKGKIHWCLNNAQMKYKEYRKKFLDVVKDLDDDVKMECINIKDDNGINSFIISCMRGYEEIVDYFVSVGAEVDAHNGWFTPLTAACRDGHLHTVSNLLDKGSNINETNINGETPLYTACFGSHYDLVKRLTEKHADVNKRNKYNRSPLYASCLVGDENITRFLIDKGANVFECKDSLIVACLGGHDKIVKTLILNDCDVNSTDIDQKTALLIACEKGFTKIVSMLLDNNADIYKVDSDGRTPLHASCYSGNNCIVKLLIHKEADVNMLDVDMEAPLHKACRKGYVGVIQTLLDKGADINKINKDGCTPAHYANTDGKLRDNCILKALEYREKEPTKWQNITGSKKDKFQKQDNASTSNLIRYGWTPLYEACVNGDKETVQSLIRNRANVNMKTASGEMPLVAACQEGHGFIIQVLLDERADINEALVCAVQKDYDRAVNILLYKGGDLNYTGGDGKSLITLAREQVSFKVLRLLFIKGADFKEIYVLNGQKMHNVEFLQLLTDKGLDLNITDKDGKSPLFESMEKRFYYLSEYLIHNEYSLANSEEDTKTASISVFESGNKEFSKLLVSYGSRENLSNFNETMLFHAYKLGLREKVNILLRNETNIRKKYEAGYTPLILADIDGNDDLSEYLQNHKCGLGNTFNSTKTIETVHAWKNGSIRIDINDFQSLLQACMNGAENSDMYEITPPGTRFEMFYIPRNPFESIWFEQTPLCLATRRGHIEVVKHLIQVGANVNLTFEDMCTKDDVSLSLIIRYGYTPLFAACQRKHYEIVDILLESGANLNKALYDASLEGYLDTVKLLLQKGADVNSIGRFGQTALYAACIGGNYTIVKFLIDQGAFIDMKVGRASIFDEPTCIHAAYLSDNHDIVQLLINRGAYVDAVGNFGRTLLHKACSDGNYKTVEILMDKGVDLNASDMHGATPLIMCVLQNIEANHGENAFIYKMKNYYFLEENGLNQPLGDYFDQLHKEYVHEWNKYSPSYFGSIFKLLTDNHYKVIQLLIENGADINKADKKDRTPLSLAKMIWDMKLTDILLHKVLLSIKKGNSQERNQDS